MFPEPQNRAIDSHFSHINPIMSIIQIIIIINLLCPGIIIITAARNHSIIIMACYHLQSSTIIAICHLMLMDHIRELVSPTDQAIRQQQDISNNPLPLLWRKGYNSIA